MILEQDTYKQFGYYPSELKPQSGKKILAACDDCGKVRIASKNNYHSLCGSCAKKGRSLSEETIRKIRENHADQKGEKNPNFGRTGEKHPMFGKHHTEESKRKMRDNHPDCKSEKNHMFGRTGEKNSNWKGGLSFEPYCPKFNKDFKERVRILFDRKCFECGKTEEENGKKLDVHHVNYDKMVCCNDVEPLFVALCRCHNSKANGNREWWEAHFIEKLLAEHNGKCYYTKEEVENSLLRWKIL